MNESEIRTALAQPDRVLRELDRLDAEESLHSFTQQHWHVIEPARKFVSGWHIQAICEHLEAVTKGQITRLLINVPPGFTKSLMTNVFWPAWEWGPRNLPAMRYVSASYSSALTIRDNRRCRNLLTSREYTQVWGNRFRLMDDQNAKMKYENDKTGWRIATSVEGLGTGERGDRVTVDDPHNVMEGESEASITRALMWFTEVLPTRMNDPEASAIVVIMQRVSAEDISGYILANDLGYTHLMLPMEYEPERCSYTVVRPSWSSEPPIEARYLPARQIWIPASAEIPDDLKSETDKIMALPVQTVYKQDKRTEDGELLFPTRFPASVVERDKKVMGAYAAAGQFQQRPTPRSGAMFQREWFEIVEEAPRGGQVVRAWDLAGSQKSGSAFTVGVRMRKHRGTFYIEHVVRARATPARVEELIKECARSDQDAQPTRISIPQDPGQAGLSQKMSMAQLLAGFDVRFSPESGDKEVRARALSAQAEVGNVRLVRGTWNRDFLDEISVFPSSKYKDQVDATTRAFNELVKLSSFDNSTVPAGIQVGAASMEPA